MTKRNFLKLKSKGCSFLTHLQKSFCDSKPEWTWIVIDFPSFVCHTFFCFFCILDYRICLLQVIFCETRLRNCFFGVGPLWKRTWDNLSPKCASREECFSQKRFGKQLGGALLYVVWFNNYTLTVLTSRKVSSKSKRLFDCTHIRVLEFST